MLDVFIPFSIFSLSFLPLKHLNLHSSSILLLQRLDHLALCDVLGSCVAILLIRLESGSEVWIISSSKIVEETHQVVTELIVAFFDLVFELFPAELDVFSLFIRDDVGIEPGNSFAVLEFVAHGMQLLQASFVLLLGLFNLLAQLVYLGLFGGEACGDFVGAGLESGFEFGQLLELVHVGFVENGHGEMVG